MFRKPDNDEDLVVWKKASRKNATPMFLLEASYHENPAIRYVASANPQIPVERLYEMFRTEKTITVLAGVAANPVTPDDLLNAISVKYHRNYPVIANTALYTSIKTSEQLNKALKDNYQIKLVHTKYELYDEESIRIMLNREEAWLRTKVINIPNLGEELMRKLAEEKDYDVLIVLAANKKCPPDILAKLGKSRSLRVRRAVAKNKNTEVEVLKTFLQHDSNYIKYALLKHPATTKDMIETILKGETTTMSVKKVGVKALKKTEEYKDYPLEWLEAMHGVQSK